MEGATSDGVPTVRCIWCAKILQHPYVNGCSGMLDHIKSQKCSRRRNQCQKDPDLAEMLRNQGEKVILFNSFLLSEFSSALSLELLS